MRLLWRRWTAPSVGDGAGTPSTGEGRPANPIARGDRVPALDGVRGLAVVAVIAFHAWPWLVQGGWLGVGLFFTLSGYLIVSLVLRDLTDDDFDLRGFMTKRFRRLLPAALLTIAATLGATAILEPDAIDRVAGDALAAVLNVANWRGVFEPVGYEALFDDSARPLAHFWSLAIEEQFYLVVPALLVLTKRPKLVIAGLWVVAAASIALLWGNSDAYLATPVRIAEILAGATLALVTMKRRVVPPLSLVILSAMAAVGAVSYFSETNPFTYRGLPAAMGVVWVVLIAHLVGAGRGTSLLEGRVLSWLGTRSYGLYLVHWPILELTSWHPVVALSATAAITEVSYRVVETPIRHGSVLKRPVLALGSASLALAVVAGATLMIPDGDPSTAVAAEVPDWFSDETGEATDTVPLARMDDDTVTSTTDPANPNEGDANQADTNQGEAGDSIPMPGDWGDTAPDREIDLTDLAEFVDELEGLESLPPADSTATPGPTTTTPSPVTEPTTTEAPPTTAQTTTTEPTPPLIVFVLGDSTGVAFAEGLRSWGDETRSAVVISGAAGGCPPFADESISWFGRKWNEGKGECINFAPRECVKSVEDLRTETGLTPDVVLVSDFATATWEFSPERGGDFASIADEARAEQLLGLYDRRVAQAKAVGASVVFTTGPPLGWRDEGLVEVYNGILRDWARGNSGAVVVESGPALENNPGRFPMSDNVHIDEGAPSALFAEEILAPALAAAAG